MSPESRRAAHSGGPGRSRPARRPSRAPDSPANALFAEMLRAARELLAVRSPLDAELMVSELLGTWWRLQPGTTGGTAHRRADIEELVGEGLVAYAAEQRSPAALALLSGIACLGTSRQAAEAERAALDLMAAGVARPGWAEHAGAVEAAECYVSSDLYGDRDEFICTFSYAGQENHALVLLVDYNASGMIRDGWVTSQVPKLLEYSEDGAADGSTTFGKVPPHNARQLLESALTATEAAANPPVSKSFPSYHALVRARIRTLPPPPSGSTSGRQSSGPTNVGPGATRRPTWRKDRRATLAAEFLASDEAEDLSDIEAASSCVDQIVDYGCDQDFGRPLRVSPAKVEAFLIDWLPRKVMLTPAEQHAMPHVLIAWTRWAGARSGLDIAAISKTLDAVFDAMATFSRVYHDPASFGLERSLVTRLLPDRDLEALPRRAFALPVLEGTFQGTDLSLLDPADTADRRVLLAADHIDVPDGATARHLDQHEELADRLWRGDPAELWDTAQRLFDQGQARHDVLHALLEAIASAGSDPRSLRLALLDLPERTD